MVEERDDTASETLSQASEGRFHARFEVSQGPWREGKILFHRTLVTGGLDENINSVDKHLLNNEKITFSLDRKNHLETDFHFEAVGSRGCKHLKNGGLSTDHKILGLFLDRPQELAVMSKAQRRDFEGQQVDRPGGCRTGMEWRAGSFLGPPLRIRRFF